MRGSERQEREGLPLRSRAQEEKRRRQRWSTPGNSRRHKILHNAAALSYFPYSLTQGAFEAFGGLLKLALQGVDLLRYSCELPFGKHSSVGNLVSLAIRSAQGAPNFH